MIKEKGNRSNTMKKVGIFNLKLFLWMINVREKNSDTMNKAEN